MSDFVFDSIETLQSKLFKCTDCCNGDYLSYHCPLCPVSKYKPKKRRQVEQHLVVHWNTRIRAKNGVYSIVCHLHHYDNQSRHFHCPSCGKTIKKKENMVEHSKKCDGNPTSRGNTVGNEKDNPVNFPEHSYSLSDRVDELPVTDSNDKGKKMCPKCGKSVNKRWLKKHISTHERKSSDIDKSRHHHTALIDANAGIYCASINLSGPLVPIHLVKKTSGPNQDNFCEHQQCIDRKDVARRGDNLAYECSHIKSIPFAVRGRVVTLHQSSLEELKSVGFFTEDRFKELSLYQTNVSLSGSPLIVEVPQMEHASERYVYISVKTGVQRYWSKIGRTIVTFDKIQNTFTCKCSSSKRYCTHKAIGKWFVYQEYPQFFQSTSKDQSEKSDSDTDVHDLDKEIDTNKKESLDKMLEYLISTKKIPSKISSDSISVLCERREFISNKKIVPLETTCHLCNGNLMLEECSTKSKIVLLNKIVTDICVYIKICPRCRTSYRYQEWTEGIHNFNNNLFLGLDVCHYLRAGLQNHVAIGRSLSVLEDMLLQKLNVDEIHKAYLHFESMTDHNYNFNCILCGFFPSVIIWDTFRKATFRFAVSDMKTPPEQDVNDEVNIKEYWEKIEQNVVKRGFSKDKLKDTLLPNFEFWAPWIGEKTRKGNLVYNTEYKKCGKSNDDVIQEPMAEELLIHLLLDEKVTAIRKLCKEIGVNTGGSAMDMILRLRHNSVSTSTFDKAYEKVFGCSGGWAVGCCRHGIVYAIKNLLRSESPRDYVDLERSMLHRPTITISDIAHLLASHGNKTAPNFFHPNNGRLDIPNEETLRNAENGNVYYSMPFLTEPCTDYSESDANNNPTTGVSDHYSLYDWFHQENCRKREEVLRRSSLVKELAGFVDTQAVEQLFSASKKDLYFLNNFQPSNHMFMFRLIYHLRNEKLNSKLYQKLEKEFGEQIKVNNLGQVCQEYLPFLYVAEPVLKEKPSEIAVETQITEQEQDTEDRVDVEPQITTRKMVNNLEGEVDLPILQTMNETTTEKTTEIEKQAAHQCFQFSVLKETVEAISKDISKLTPDEINNLKINITYANSVLFKQADPERKANVKVYNTKYGLFQNQGFSNYCGLCAVNNAIGFVMNSATNVDEMDAIADNLWLSMVDNPSCGLTVAIEPFRDREGFYSVEVMQSVLQSKGFQMLQLNANAIRGVKISEVGDVVKQQILEEFGFATLIVRPSSSQHWLAIRCFGNQTDLLLDSAKELPLQITTERLGVIISKNVSHPGAVYFLCRLSNPSNNLKGETAYIRSVEHESITSKGGPEQKNQSSDEILIGDENPTAHSTPEEQSQEKNQSSDEILIEDENPTAHSTPEKQSQEKNQSSDEILIEDENPTAHSTPEEQSQEKNQSSDEILIEDENPTAHSTPEKQSQEKKQSSDEILIGDENPTAHSTPEEQSQEKNQSSDEIIIEDENPTAHSTPEKQSQEKKQSSDEILIEDENPTAHSTPEEQSQEDKHTKEYIPKDTPKKPTVSKNKEQPQQMHGHNLRTNPRKKRKRSSFIYQEVIKRKKVKDNCPDTHCGEAGENSDSIKSVENLTDEKETVTLNKSNDEQLSTHGLISKMTNDDSNTSEDEDSYVCNKNVTVNIFHENAHIIIEMLYEMMECTDHTCQVVEHFRHHEFIHNPLTVYNRERVTHGFGSDIIPFKVSQSIEEYLRAKLVYIYRDPKHPYSSGTIAKIRKIENAELNKIFNRNGLIVYNYVRCVCVKESVLWLLTRKMSLPYEVADDKCKKTEVSVKDFLKRNAK